MAQANTTLSLVCAVYSLLLIFVGTFGGLITFVKCFLKPYRVEPTFVLLAFLRWADIACLYQWNLKHVLVPFFQINYEGLNLSLCKFSVFMQFYSLKLSAWLLVSNFFFFYEYFIKSKGKKYKNFINFQQLTIFALGDDSH
jgi:hypothetical protein